MGAMPTFTLDGVTYEYLQPDGGRPEEARSWEYGSWPKVHAQVPLAGGGAAPAYGRAERWTPTHILVRWLDDDGHPHSAWLPYASVRRVSDSEWDIEEFHRTPEWLRPVRWGSRLPGFLPE